MTSEQAYYRALYVSGGRYPEGEAIIAEDAQWSYYYAVNVVHGRFIEGEAVIAQDARWAFYYTCNIIKGRFLEAEKLILRSRFSNMYIRKFLESINWKEEGF